MIIGDRLREMREEKKLSQGDIEKRTGLLRCYPDFSFWLVVGLKVGAVLVGLVTQGVLKLAEYLVRGAERALPGKPI